MGDMVEELLVIKQLVLSRETRPSNHSLRLVRILMETMMGDMVVEESLVIKQFVLSRHRAQCSKRGQAEYFDG